MSLRLQMILWFAVIALLVGTLGAVAVNRQKAAAEALAMKDAEHIVASLGASITFEDNPQTNPALYRNPNALQGYVELLHNVYQRDLEIVDLNKIIIADAVKKDIGTLLTHDSNNEVGQTMKDGNIRYYVEKSAEYPQGIKLIVSPLKNMKGDIIGALIFEYTQIINELNSIAKSTIKQLILATIICLILAIILGLIFSEHIIRPINRLKSTALEIVNGNILAQAPIVSKDEIGELAATFNTMTSSLAQSNQKLQAEITERQRTSEERDQVVALLDTMAVLVLVLDQEGRIIRFNRACQRVIGYSREEVKGRPSWEIMIAPEDVSRTQAMFTEMLAGRIPPVFEVDVITKGGERRLFSWYYALLPTENGTTTSIIGAGLDITDRKRAEEALRLSESRYRTLVENISLGISLIGADYKIIMTNAGMGKIFRKPPQEFVGKNCFREFEKRDEICTHCPGAKTMVSGQPEEVDTIGVHDDGTFHYAHVRTFPTFDSLGKVTGFVEVVEDTTARRQIEEQLAWEDKVNSSVAELTRALLASRSIEDISQMVLDSAVALTNSSVGYCGYLDPQTGHFIVPTLSGEVWEACNVPEKNIIFEKFAGLWGYGLQHRQPVVSNDLAADPRSSGIPQGHIPIHNFVSVPAMLGEHLMGQLAVANAPQDYAAKDQGVCERLALVYALSIQRQKAEEALRQSEARFRDITANVAEWVWEMDSEGKLTYSSPVVEQLLGYKSEEVLGRYFYDLFLPDERQEFKEQTFALFDAKQPFRDFIMRCLRKNGEIVWFSSSGVPTLDEQGNLLGYRGANSDITARRQAQEALENANLQLKVLVQEAEARNSTMAQLNNMSEMLQTCQTSEEAFSTISHFVPQFFPTDAGALYLLRNSKNLLSSVTTWGPSPPIEEMFPPDDCWAVRSGRVHRVDDPASALLCKHIPMTGLLAHGYLCVPLMAQGNSLGILHIRFLSCATQGRETEALEAKQRLALAIAENLALSLANLKLRETLQNQAIRDPLTGLYNRRYLEETMDRELHRSRRLKAPLGVVMMDLDHFKDFNDSLGHGAGDVVLSALAHVITAGIRTEDIACRYGGEEFLLVIPGASLEITRERAENVRQGVKALHVKYQDRFLKSPTISLGVAIFPDHGVTAEEVIAAADAALYRAKKAGRDRVEIATLQSPEAAAP
jgi:diguanylate cyclase (GGDEF)-like protein/PAS domain S-box-containing protein